MEKTVAIDELVPHPLNANRQPPQVTRKLRANIERTGKYPAIIVRTLNLPGVTYQILDGEHRWKILRDLGHTRVTIDDWGAISDEDALKLLATLNPLRGRDERRKRASILAILRKYHDADDLAQILPEEGPQIDRMIEKLETPELTDIEEQALSDGMESVSFLVTADMKRVINAALRHRQGQGNLPGQSIDPDRFRAVIGDYHRGRALYAICADYVLQSSSDKGTLVHP